MQAQSELPSVASRKVPAWPATRQTMYVTEDPQPCSEAGLLAAMQAGVPNQLDSLSLSGPNARSIPARRVMP